MIKQKYQTRFEQLKAEGKWEYFIVGSPTHMRWIREVVGDRLEELYKELVKLNEIEGVEEGMDLTVGVTEDKEYGELIHDFLKDSNDFFYYKANF